MPRYIRYFNTQARLDRSFLHPGGKSATEQLIHTLKLNSTDVANNLPILEIGCGLGNTAVMLLEEFRCNYIGIDSSPLMLERARSLLSTHGGRASFMECDLSTREIPLTANSVSCIIAESVFAILEPRKILKECRRVLSTGGVLVWNDRVWSADTTDEERTKANKLCERVCGCKAASVNPATSKEWQMCVEEIGFELRTAQQIVSSTNAQNKEQRMEYRSKWTRLRPSVAATVLLDRYISSKYKHIWSKMENWLFVAVKR